MAARITRRYITEFGFIHLHDHMALAFTVDPTLFVTREYHVDVETTGALARGQTIADKREWLPRGHREPTNASICTSVDGEGFLELFLQRLDRIQWNGNIQVAVARLFLISILRQTASQIILLIVKLQIIFLCGFLQ